MSKKISIIVALFLGLGIFFGSCSDDDNNNQISESWIAYQKKMVTDVMTLTGTKTGNKIYTPLKSDLADGRYVYYRPSDYINNNMAGIFDKNGPDALGQPKEELEVSKREVIEKIKCDTDIVEVRFHAWYYNENGSKTVFSSTERENGAGVSTNFKVGGLIDGFKTVLYDMELGEERIVCIPHELAYGASGYNNIIGYTTLFYDVKLMSITR